jgi:hypothetical protein
MTSASSKPGDDSQVEAVAGKTYDQLTFFKELDQDCRKVSVMLWPAVKIAKQGGLVLISKEVFGDCAG